MELTKSMNNVEIAELLRSVAAAYQLKRQNLPAGNRNKFKIIAYQRAADAVEHASSELKDLWDEGKLDDVPGIGPSIAAHLGELFKTGSSKHFKEVMRGLPPAMFDLMEIPGIGAKRAFRLTQDLRLKTVGDLKSNQSRVKLQSLKGLGKIPRMRS